MHTRVEGDRVVDLPSGTVSRVRDGAPFTERNVKRLRTLGVVVLVGVPLANLISSLCATELASSAGFDGSGASLTIPADAVLGGLAAFVLAEVFSHGARLRVEQEGTI